jgi:PAS domain S-box-containing protein
MILEPIKILLVEDKQEAARKMFQILEHSNEALFKIASISVKDKILTGFSEDDCDVILLYLSQKDTNDLETISQIHAFAPDTPLIVLTDQPEKEFVNQALQRGVDGCFDKENYHDELFVRTLIYFVKNKRKAETFKKKEKALQKELDLLRVVIDGIPDPIYAKDLQGRYLMVNSTSARNIGKSVDEIIGRSDNGLISPETVDSIKKDDKRVIEIGQVQTFEAKFTTAGTNKIFLTTKAPYRDHDGNITGVFGISRDITQLKLVEEKLRSEHSFRKAIEDSMLAGITVVDLSSRIIYVNSAFCNMVGWTEKELLGSTPPYIYWPPEEAENIMQGLQNRLRNGAPRDAEYVFCRRNGERFPVSILVAPLMNSSGNKIGIVGSIYDITDRNRAEDALRSAERSALSFQQQLIRERDRLSLLLNVNNAVISSLDFKSLIDAISKCLCTLVPHDIAALVLYEPNENQFRILALNGSDLKGGLMEDQVWSVDGKSPASIALITKKPVLMGEEAITTLPSGIVSAAFVEGIKNLCNLPLVFHDRVLGAIVFFSRKDIAFTDEHVSLMTQVASQITIAFDNALAFQKIAELKDKLAKEKVYLEDEIRTEYNFEEIIGESSALKRVLMEVETVAPTDSTVLIRGETGTGKELIARAIHRLSNRHEQTFVKLNCAAIPSSLLESELFGSEKGAFTGAIAQKIGRFELAHLGTLFLDEVGDIPLELQAKLLRVLQEQEFERLGSTNTIKVNVRIIAATNQNLTQMVANKEFRSELFYRFNVFPIIVPPLGERPEDIPRLVRYFVKKYALRMNKQIKTIPKETMTALSNCRWPGNIRELQNLIERSVILSNSSTLRVPLGELNGPAITAPDKGKTLDAAEREHILRVLEETHWIIGGPSGAAIQLGLKRTTLHSKMKRLKIIRQI